MGNNISLHFLVVEDGLREPFHARDWLENYGQGPCGTLTIALSPCGRLGFANRQMAVLGNLQFGDCSNLGILQFGGSCNFGELAILGNLKKKKKKWGKLRFWGTCNFGELTILGNLQFWG